MITVRFPTGLSIQYNDAHYADRRDHHTDLYTNKDGIWIAQVPNDALIESVKPCRVYMATEPNQDEIFDKVDRRMKKLEAKLSSVERAIVNGIR